MSKLRSQSLAKQRVGVKQTEGRQKARLEPETPIFVSKISGLKNRSFKSNQFELNKVKPTLCRPIKRNDISLESQIITPLTQSEIKEAKKKYLQNNRVRLQYLKKNLTKSTCDLSILDFWTNEMLANTLKLIQKPARKTKNSVFLPKLGKGVRSLKQSVIKAIYPSSKLDDYIKNIENICNSTSIEMQVLRSDIRNSINTINKLN